MIKIHLNEAQRTFVQKWLNDNPTRPESDDYIRAGTAIGKLEVGKRPKPREIPYTATGDELVPLVGFHAIRDLPAGWATTSAHDSGGNHIIENAGEAMLRRLWNCWGAQPTAPLGKVVVHFGTEDGGIAKELKSNKITP